MTNIASKIQQRRYQILIHSYIYYYLNLNLISDHKYDTFARELSYLQQIFPDISKKVKFYEDFKDFGCDGSYSGFNFKYNDEIIKKANFLVDKFVNKS